MKIEKMRENAQESLKVLKEMECNPDNAGIIAGREIELERTLKVCNIAESMSQEDKMVLSKMTILEIESEKIMAHKEMKQRYGLSWNEFKAIAKAFAC